MKRCMLLISSLVLAGSAVAADFSKVPSGTYEVDPVHAYVNFQYNHLGLSNPTLQFDKFDITMDLDNADPTKSSVSLEIAADSFDAGSEIWHEHLVGEKWFDTANYPSLTFQSTEIAANADGTYNVTGDLTIKDTTKPAMIVVTVNGAMDHPISKKPVIGISAVGGILRSDWGMGASVPFVSDEVKLEIQAEMKPAS